MKKRLDSFFSVFNLHMNNAGKRADEEIIARFGEDIFDRYIKPYYDRGIMSIFDHDPTRLNYVVIGWLALVTYFVNEDRGKSTNG